MKNTLLLLGAFAMVATASAEEIPLTPGDRLELLNVNAAQETYKGKAGIRVEISDEMRAREEARAARRQAGTGKKAGKKAGAGERGRTEVLAIVKDLEFGSGTIELDIAGEPAPGASGGARGFVGVAFRVQPDNHTYDTVYLRPTNGRADDQERRNHTVQYISHPDWPWFRLRQETPSKYETYADIQPAEWIHLKITVDGEKARVYVNDAEQPTLVVNDVKSGPDGKGRVALWMEGSTIARYANLKITSK